MFIWSIFISIFPGEFVAQFKYTVLLTTNGPITVTGVSLENSLNLFKSEFKIDDPEVKVIIVSIFLDLL